VGITAIIIEPKPLSHFGERGRGEGYGNVNLMILLFFASETQM